MILVVGGGITGMAAARTLGEAGAEHLLVEREAEPGGWCRSLHAGGYTFDMSGHFLHGSDTRMREWILGLGGISWRTVRRDARVFLRGKLTPFPFQANLYGHSSGLIRRCLEDFAEERIREAVGEERAETASFRDWLLRRFGKTMCREFFFPYNRKMWRTPLSAMEPSWTSWSVPVPSFEELVDGARGRIQEGLGYNPAFLYPVRGGIGVLSARLAQGTGGALRTGVRVVRIDPDGKRAWSDGGEEFRYAAAVSTIPLPALSLMCEPVPEAVRAAAKALRWVKVLTVNLGVRSPAATQGHWIYVPGSGFPFYRVGFLSNVCPKTAPEGCASIFAEASYPSGARVDLGEQTRRILSGLRQMGILHRGQRPEEVRPVLLDPAYVVFDHERKKAVKALREYFHRRGIFTAGRYGAWEYNGMETSMADGIRAAREALRRVAAGGR